MAGQKFEYDESGSTFLYFLISFLGLVLLPCTYYCWPVEKKVVPNKEIVKKKGECRCAYCLKKRESFKKPEKWKEIKKVTKQVLIVCGWVFLAFLVYKVQEFDYEYANFDPYDILGVSTHSSQAEIKRAYRKQSLIFHPDKPTGDEKKFMKLNKAYQALTDDVARRNYELYGHPDGPGSMHFGIALPSWIVEKENSIWVLGLYGLVFMIGLPSCVAVWWYRSSKFSNDQVLLGTTQLYYYFFHKTPHMVFKRALMVLAASLEFEKGHNPEIVERPSDNLEIPLLIKQLPNLGEKNKERPLCFAYSIKARALLHAHLSRMKLPDRTLDLDRQYIVKCCPTLIQEMVTCVAQLVMLAHAGRISHLPSLDTIENTMNLCPRIVQALWDCKTPLHQLPHITDESLRHFANKRKPVKTVAQLLALPDDERRLLLRWMTDEQYEDVINVASSMPYLKMEINYEVVDDEDSGEFTAGAIVTVTVNLLRYSMLEYVEMQGTDSALNADDKYEKNQNKKSSWRPPQKKHSKGKGKNMPPSKKKGKQNAAQPTKKETNDKKKDDAKKETSRVDEILEDSDVDDSGSHSDESRAEEADTESHREEKNTNDDDDEEWEKFQKGLTKREKVLEGKSKVSHTVHCPFYSEDKQEYWWAYVCDRKKHMLITAPFQVTDLVDQEEVQLKFTAPLKPGVYTYQVCVRSDSYLGVDLFQDIKLDVKEAREIPTEHPQWQEFSSDDEDDQNGQGTYPGDESEFTTDDEVTDDSD